MTKIARHMCMADTWRWNKYSPLIASKLAFNVPYKNFNKLHIFQKQIQDILGANVAATFSKTVHYKKGGT
jgi:hypothetical protein